MDEDRPPPAAPSSQGRRKRSGASPASGAPVLPDPWSRRGPLPLDGWLERNRFAPLLAALLGLVAAFVAFQLIGTGVTLALVARAVPLDELARELGPERLMSAHVAETIFGNSVGQVLGLALPAAGLAWLHTSRPGAFLRLRRPPWALAGLGLLGLAGLLPVVGWLTQLNQQLPVSEALRNLEDMRMDMIVQVLKSDLGLWASLLGLAATPAFCEELLFRGYAQRHLERSLGAAAGIFLTGLLFGLYHLSPLQLLPLSVLGGYLAYLTWRTGSLWPAVFVHFANNAWSVVGAEMAMKSSDVNLSEVEGGAMPWYTVAGGLILFAAVVFFLHTYAPRWQPKGEGRRANGER